MPVHIDQVTSEVSLEAEPLEAPIAASTVWQELDRVVQLPARRQRDRLRTACEGFDD